MKRFLSVAVVGLFLSLPASLFAQAAGSLGGDHFQAGVFADYFRLDRSDPKLNFAGFGGRVGFNMRPSVALEGEMAYDFERGYTNIFSNGVTQTFARSNTHVLHGLFGPKFQTGSGPVRLFATGKVGFISFTTNSQGVGAGFKSALGAVGNGDMKFSVYPGGGIEGFLGPVGLRLEVGDEIYFDNGARNNLRVTFGPTIRF
jgi:hypothetical protein